MRQFVSAVNPDKKGLIELSGKDFRYFKQVLRLSAGDMVFVRIPEGKLVSMTLAKIDEKSRRLILQLCDTTAAPNENALAENQSEYKSEVNFYLFQFVAKGPKMDLIVRQASECGVLKVIPVLGEFSQKGGEEKNFRSARYERIIKEARQQSGSPVPTEILETKTLEHSCAFWKELTQDNKDESFACVLYERSEKTQNLFKALAEYKTIKNCAVFCGAEGGISPDEIEFLREQNIIPVHFETNILRCETAALYGMACVQNAITEKTQWQTTD